MNKLNQKGLSHLGLIVLAVALLITGTAGFLVYSTNNKNTEKKEDSIYNPTLALYFLDNFVD